MCTHLAQISHITHTHNATLYKISFKTDGSLSCGSGDTTPIPREWCKYLHHLWRGCWACPCTHGYFTREHHGLDRKFWWREADGGQSHIFGGLKIKAQKFDGTAGWETESLTLSGLDSQTADSAQKEISSSCPSTSQVCAHPSGTEHIDLPEEMWNFANSYLLKKDTRVRCLLQRNDFINNLLAARILDDRELTEREKAFVRKLVSKGSWPTDFLTVTRIKELIRKIRSWCAVMHATVPDAVWCP